LRWLAPAAGLLFATSVPVLVHQGDRAAALVPVWVGVAAVLSSLTWVLASRGRRSVSASIGVLVVAVGLFLMAIASFFLALLAIVVLAGALVFGLALLPGGHRSITVTAVLLVGTVGVTVGVAAIVGLSEDRGFLATSIVFAGGFGAATASLAFWP
jgi:hypothetical protein